MKNIKMILIALILVTALSSVFAEDNAAAVYSRMGIDARSIGMGGTGAAFLDNVSSAFLNPAVLADVKRIELTSATRQNMEWDKSQNALAVGFNLPIGFVAASWLNAGVTGFEGQDASGVSTGAFDTSENLLGISYAVKYRRLNVGITPKMYMSKIADESTTGFGLDMGMMFHATRYFNLGFVARDIVSNFDGEGTEVPREFIPSIAAYPIPGLIIAADLIGEDSFETTRLKLGAEYWLGVGEDGEIGSSLSGIRIRENTTWSNVMSKMAAGIRGGVNDGNFTAGLGFRFKMLEMNYAYQMAKDSSVLNDHHVYSLLLRF